MDEGMKGERDNTGRYEIHPGLLNGLVFAHLVYEE